MPVTNPTLTLNGNTIGSYCWMPLKKKQAVNEAKAVPGLWESYAYIDQKSQNLYYVIEFRVWDQKTTPARFKNWVGGLRDDIGEGPFDGQWTDGDLTINYYGLHWNGTPTDTADDLDQAGTAILTFITRTRPSEVS